jgi:hypothetical protein
MEEKMENTEIIKKKVGNVEQPRSTVSPAVVKIASVLLKTKDKNDKEMTTPLVQFMVKHPDKEELITISKVKYIDGDKAVAKGFWVQTDDDDNFYKGSAIDLILKKLGVETLDETYGKDIDTIEESKDSPYLCLKAY